MTVNASEGSFFEDRTSERDLVGIEEPPRGRSEGSFGVGVFVSDINLNGAEDLLVLTGSSPTLFENKGRKYEASNSLPELDRQVTSALFFDHDNNGYEDLYLLSDEGSVFLQNVDGEFNQLEVGLEHTYGSVRGAAVADYTDNGCLDVFVVQANDWGSTRPVGVDDRSVSVREDSGNQNRLFTGDCDGFEETTDEAGIEGNGWSLATSFVDLTNDGAPDIHVANDFNNDVLYLNQGDGTFERRVMPEFTNRNGMSSEVADVTGNGYLDIFVSNIYDDRQDRYDGRTEGNNLLLNQGNGTFVDAAEEYGVLGREANTWGWAALLEDFDNNGYLELFHTGMWSKGSGEGEGQGVFWKNDGEGDDDVNNFRRISSSVAGLGTEPSVGAVSVDTDRTGSLDVIEATIESDSEGKPPGVVEVRENVTYNENRLAAGNWLQVSVSSDYETTPIGTRVYADTGSRTQMRVLTSESDYLSQSSRVMHFGLGDARSVDELRVDWFDAGEEVYTDVAVNQRVTVPMNESGEKQ